MRYFLFSLWLALSASFANPASATEPLSFHTPSKNVYCYAAVSDAVTTIDCELLTRDNGKPLRPTPADCEQDWGNRFAISDTGKAFMVCAGDTLRGNEAGNLPYGERLDYFGIACTSTRQGLECINDNGHGFKISKSKQEMY